MNSSSSRKQKIFSLYKNGKTLEEIGEIFNFSRSRAQQIVIQEMKRCLINDLGLYKHQLSRDEQLALDVAAKEEIREISLNRKKAAEQSKSEDITRRIKEKIKSIPDHSIFYSLSAFAKALDEDVTIVKKYLPDIAKDILSRQKKKWSRYYDKCRSCGTFSVRHASYGLCEKCYFKSDIFKEMQEASRLRNKEKNKNKQKAYHREYTKRPEIREKNKLINDLRNFNGNREKAIARDNYRCVNCGMTRSQSQKTYNRDLYVKRSDENSNNLDNLITLCPDCFRKRMMIIMRSKKNK